MNISARAARKALEEIPHHFHLPISPPPSLDLESRPTESFIHGHGKITGPQNSAAISQRAIEDLAQSNTKVLHGVMLVDVQIAQSGELQIECAVPCKQLQHVVEKTDSS